MPTLPFRSPDVARSRWALGRLLKEALDSLIAVANHRLETLNVTFAQCPTMLYLLDVGTATQSEIAIATETDTGAMTRLIERLRHKDLCLATRAEHDRRIVYLSLTPKGVRAAEEISAVLDDVLDAHLVDIDAVARSHIVSTLRRMISNGRALTKPVAPLPRYNQK